MPDTEMEIRKRFDKGVVGMLIETGRQIQKLRTENKDKMTYASWSDGMGDAICILYEVIEYIKKKGQEEYGQ